jgi:hypothetical protein
VRRLSTAIIRLAMDRGGHTSQINTHVVAGLVDLWFRKDERQRVLWNPRVPLVSPDNSWISDFELRLVTFGR